MRTKWFAASLLTLFILVLSAYSNTFNSPPVLDDFHSFVQEKHTCIKDFSFSSIHSLSKTAFTWKRWIPMLTFATDRYLGKGEIFYFHLTNILIHIFCTMAVLFMIYQFISLTQEKRLFPKSVYPTAIALWVASLWALNPVQTNAVTYLVQRMASIQSLFYVLAISAYTLGRREQIASGNIRKAALSYMGCFAAAACAFCSKENSAMLPAMIIVTEIWFFTPELLERLWLSVKKSNLYYRLGFVLLFLAAVVILSDSFSSIMQGYSKRHFSLQERLLTESRIVLWYLSLLILPLPSRMSIEHDVTVSTSVLNPPSTLFAIILLGGVFYSLWLFRKRYPLMTYGGAWFFLNLMIESTFVPLELVFEHRLYLPSIGFSLFLVAASVQTSRFLMQRFSKAEYLKALWSGFAILCSCLTLMTFERNKSWHDFVTINEDAVAKAPKHPRAHANMAVAYGRAGRYEKAIQEAETTLKLGRPHFEDYIVAGNVIVGSLIGMGKQTEAVTRGKEIIEGYPLYYDAGSLPNFCLHIAQAHLDLKEIKDAYSSASLGLKYASRISRNYYELKLVEGMFTRILEISKNMQLDLNGDGKLDPGSIPIRTWIAKEFLAVGEREQAKELLSQVMVDNPDELESVRLMEILERDEKLDQIQQQKEGIWRKYIERPYSVFNICMAGAYVIRDKKLPSPLKELGEWLVRFALKSKPHSPDANLLMAWYCYDNKDFTASIEYANKSIEQDPASARSYMALGFFLAAGDKPQEALNAFQRVLELHPGFEKKSLILGLLRNLEQGIETLNTSSSLVK